MQAVLRLYREARRRKVFRTGALYVLGAWAYQHAGQETKAAQLLDSAARQCEELRSSGRLRDSMVIHRCASTTRTGPRSGTIRASAG